MDETTRTIQVDLESRRVADELAEYLGAHGLVASVVGTDDHVEIEVSDAVDPAERLREAFEDSLRAWLATASVPLVPIARPDRSYVIRFPGD